MNPPNARKIEIHNLIANTKYEFQVMGINQYGDGMFSEIIEASTKGKKIIMAIPGGGHSGHIYLQKRNKTNCPAL